MGFQSLKLKLKLGRYPLAVQCIGQDGVVGSWIGDPGPSPTVTQLAGEEQPWALKANFDVSPVPKREYHQQRKKIMLTRCEGVPNDETALKTSGNYFTQYPN